MNRGTLNQLFFTTVDRHASLPAAFRSKVGGVWVPITHRQALERVQAISLGLRELGIKPGDKVAIVSENRPEWALSDYACLTSRTTDVPIYPTLTAKQTEYILRDSESVAAFVSTAEQLDKVLEARGNLPALRHVIVFDAPPPPRPGGGAAPHRRRRRARGRRGQGPSRGREAPDVAPGSAGGAA